MLPWNTTRQDIKNKAAILKILFSFRRDQGGIWEQNNAGMGITGDRVKTGEKSMIRTTQAPSAEAEKIEDIGKTADLLEILYDPAAIFLKVEAKAI